MQSLSTSDAAFRGTSASYSAPIGKCHCTASPLSDSTQQLFTVTFGAAGPAASSSRGSVSRRTRGRYVILETEQNAGSGAAIAEKSSA